MESNTIEDKVKNMLSAAKAIKALRSEGVFDLANSPSEYKKRLREHRRLQI